MKKIVKSFTRNFINNQKGQILPWVGFLTVGLFGVGGLSVDLGRAYVASAQLQSYANASALSAAGRLTTSSATTYADTYSASGGDKNANSNLGTVTTTVSTMCANVLMPSGSSCSSTSTANAIKVTQTATVPTTFLRLFGKNSLTISSSAMASMQGAAQSWNVAVVLDATGSMSSAPSSGSCTGSSTEFACALNGVQTLLKNVNSQGSFHVALFSFPDVSTATVSKNWTCGGKPTNEHYTFPATDLSASTGYQPLTYTGSPTSATTYEDTPTSGLFSSEDGDANGFVTDYYSATASNHLNSNSSIVKAVTGCMTNPGGEGTYYGGVIYAAQAALLAEQKANSGSKNALIILSDGQAQAGSGSLASGSPTGTYSGDGVSALSSPSGSSYYPSATNECQQAIAAAQAAQSAGTTVYSIAFGSEDSGCTTGGGGTDKSIYATATSGQPALSLSTLTPCVVMKNLASPSAADGTSYFYADTSSSSGGCADSAHSVSNISDIFFAISGDFTAPRLLPTSSKDVTLTTSN